MKQKIAVTRATSPEVLDHLREYFEVEANQADEILSPARLIEVLDGKDGAVVSGPDRFDAAVIARLPGIRALCSWAAGYTNFDLPALSEAGVLVSNAPDIMNEAVADFAWALMLAAARRVTESEHWLRTGVWKGWAYDQFLGPDIHGATLGIIGMGRIGRAIARRAAGFDMRVIYHNRTRLPEATESALRARYAAKDELLRDADHVMLALPYTPESRHAIGARELELMKPSATLVNIARGGIVDDAALAAALKAKRIAAAGLDVFEGEPAIHPALLELSNIVLTPHIGSASLPARRASMMQAADNLIAALGHGPQAGHPPSLLNPEALGRARR
jgi:glyoxylate/hydroxypyruvate/2-ketogluconate reductase